MKKALLRNAGWLLPLLLTGCFHKTHLAQNQPLVPPIAGVPMPTPPPPPSQVPTPVEKTEPAKPAEEPAPTPPPPEKPQRHASHHQRSESKPANTEVASNAASPAPEVSAIGQLSSGDPSDLRYRTEESLDATERGLKAITRTLNSQEQKTADQIREFLKQARTALSTGDVDGANTLALKAKVLLGEISQ